MLNMANVSKNMLDLRSISVTNTLLQDSYKFCKVFFFFRVYGTSWCYKGRNSLYGHFSQKSARTLQPERERDRVHQRA